MATKKAASKKTAKKSSSGVKSTVKKRSLNAGPGGKQSGDAFNNQDLKRRLGNFESAGEHARVGGRTTGVVGQTKQKNRTDNRKQK